MKVAREPVHGLWPELLPMLEVGFKQFDPFPELPLDVDQAMYEALEDVGMLRVYTAREDLRPDNKGAELGNLVGYAVFMVAPSVRRRGTRVASQDVLHTAAQVGPHVTMALVKHAEAALRAEGVNLVYHSSPIGGKFGQLLEMLHYAPTAQSHVKKL